MVCGVCACVYLFTVSTDILILQQEEFKISFAAHKTAQLVCCFPDDSLTNIHRDYLKHIQYDIQMSQTGDPIKHRLHAHTQTHNIHNTHVLSVYFSLTRMVSSLCNCHVMCVQCGACVCAFVCGFNRNGVTCCVGMGMGVGVGVGIAWGCGYGYGWACISL